jgi:hypothetical protein
MSDLFARAYAHFGAGSGSRNIAPAPLSRAESRAHGLIRGQRQNQIQHSESLPSGTDNYTVEPAGPTV